MEDLGEIQIAGSQRVVEITQKEWAHSHERALRYRVIFKKVSFGIFGTFLVSKEEKNFTIKSKDKGLSMSKFS